MNTKILGEFVIAMAFELKANEHKGDFDNWQPSPEDLISEVRYHLEKLYLALVGGNKEQVNEYAADIGNYLLKAFQMYGKPVANDYERQDAITLLLAGSGNPPYPFGSGIIRLSEEAYRDIAPIKEPYYYQKLREGILPAVLNGEPDKCDSCKMEGGNHRYVCDVGKALGHCPECHINGGGHTVLCSKALERMGMDKPLDIEGTFEVCKEEEGNAAYLVSCKGCGEYAVNGEIHHNENCTVFPTLITRVLQNNPEERKDDTKA